MGFDQLSHLTPERIIAYRDGDESPAFQRHLATCAICRKELKAARRVADLLRSALPGGSMLAFARRSPVMEGVMFSVRLPFEQVTRPDPGESRSLGTLRLTTGAEVKAAHSLQSIDIKQFIARAENVQAARTVDKGKATQDSTAGPIEVLDAHIRISGSAVQETYGVAIHLSLSLPSDQGNVPIVSTDLTVLTANFPPQTVTTDHAGNAQIVVPAGLSLLMIYTEQVLHLAIEVRE